MITLGTQELPEIIEKVECEYQKVRSPCKENEKMQSNLIVLNTTFCISTFLGLKITHQKQLNKIWQKK